MPFGFASVVRKQEPSVRRQLACNAQARAGRWHARAGRWHARATVATTANATAATTATIVGCAGIGHALLLDIYPAT
jgi:hypothetical protein